MIQFVALRFHPERFSMPSALQLQNMLAVLSAARDGVIIASKQKNMLGAAEWLAARGVLTLETRQTEPVDGRTENQVATLTDRGRSLLELLWP